ncbi:MAG: type II toxin-antitoxin system RelE/ParE family toxin [Roseiarcus sp.]
MRPLKKLQARFYETPTGRKAVREGLLGLEDGVRRAIGYDMEVRSDLSGGSIGRVIFCIAKGDMVLLHGFIKKTQKTPQRDIDLANQRRKEIE